MAKRRKLNAEAFAADAAWRFERSIPVMTEPGRALEFDEPGWGYHPAGLFEWGQRRPLGLRRPPGPRSRALLPFKEPRWGFDRRVRSGPHQGVNRWRHGRAPTVT